MFVLSKRSAERMDGLHPLLYSCVCLALRKYSKQDFLVAEYSVRDKSIQKRLVSQGFSKTMNSKHLKQNDGYSHAVDLYPCGGFKSIESIPDKAWQEVVLSMSKASADLGISLEYGYDWGWDKPHYEIKSFYK